MKLVQDLPEIFEEFGEKKREAFLEIKEYKDKGIEIAAFLASFGSVVIINKRMIHIYNAFL